MSRYLETSEQNELAQALVMTREQVERVSGDVYRWKWVIIGVHNALQASIVCAISGSHKLGALRPKIQDQWMKAYRSGGDPPRERLDDFMPLYTRMEECAFTPQAGVDDAVGWLHRRRNYVVHYLPRSWLIEVSGLPAIASKVLQVVEHLALDEHRIRWIDQQSRQVAAEEFARLKRHAAEPASK